MAAQRLERQTRAQSEAVVYHLPPGEASAKFQQVVDQWREEPGSLIEVLHEAQNSFDGLSKPVIGWIAQELGLPREDVFAVASFYTMFATEPRPRYVVRVCDCLSCHLADSDGIIDAIRDAARIAPGATVSDDGLFRLETVSCLGLCDQGPAMLVNLKRYGHLTPPQVKEIVSGLQMQATVGRSAP